MLFIKLIDGSYWLYLGIKALRSAPTRDTGEDKTSAQFGSSPFRQISTGFFCKAFNPEAPVYFLSLFTVVLSPEMLLQTLVDYGALIMFLQMLWFTAFAFFITRDAIRGRLAV